MIYLLSYKLSAVQKQLEASFPKFDREVTHVESLSPDEKVSYVLDWNASQALVDEATRRGSKITEKDIPLTQVIRKIHYHASKTRVAKEDSFTLTPILMRAILDVLESKNQSEREKIIDPLREILGDIIKQLNTRCPDKKSAPKLSIQQRRRLKNGLPGTLKTKSAQQKSAFKKVPPKS